MADFGSHGFDFSLFIAHLIIKWIWIYNSHIVSLSMYLPWNFTKELSENDHDYISFVKLSLYNIVHF